MKDLYAILGLDSDASPESIKLAYRRLAREAHPDRVSYLGTEMQTQASGRMAELNEAYSTLSDLPGRKEYDEEFRKWQAQTGAEQAAAVEAPPVPEPAPEMPSMVPRTWARPGAGVISSVVGQFSTQIHNRVLTNCQSFAWRGRSFEGFDWAVHSSFLFADYYVALRGFATADAGAAQKFTNYASLAMEKNRRLVKKNFFLLLMPFQRMTDPEQVLARCRRFAGGGSSEGAASGQTQIMLLDVTHGRSVPCGPQVDDQRFEELMKKLGLAR